MSTASLALPPSSRNPVSVTVAVAARLAAKVKSLLRLTPRLRRDLFMALKSWAISRPNFFQRLTLQQLRRHSPPLPLI